MDAKIEPGEIAKIVSWDCEGIEEPYGWQTVDTMPDGRYRLKGRKKIKPDINTVVIERVQAKATTVTEKDIDERVYYWCMSEAGRLLVDCRFIKSVA